MMFIYGGHESFVALL